MPSPLHSPLDSRLRGNDAARGTLASICIMLAGEIHIVELRSIVKDQPALAARTMNRTLLNICIHSSTSVWNLQAHKLYNVDRLEVRQSSRHTPCAVARTFYGISETVTTHGVCLPRCPRIHAELCEVKSSCSRCHPRENKGFVRIMSSIIRSFGLRPAARAWPLPRRAPQSAGNIRLFTLKHIRAEFASVKLYFFCGQRRRTDRIANASIPRIRMPATSKRFRPPAQRLRYSATLGRLGPKGAWECSHAWSGSNAQRASAEPVERKSLFNISPRQGRRSSRDRLAESSVKNEP